MEALIWIGAGVTLLGVAGLGWTIVRLLRLRRAGLADEVLRERLARVLPVNLGALFLSVIGLMLVVLGIMLG